MKQIFLDLLLYLIASSGTSVEDVQVVLVGDSQQMIYDYDPDDAANLKIFENPGAFFGVSFERVRLSTSFRLAPKCAAFANALLPPRCERLVGGNTRSTDAKVDFLVASPFQWRNEVFRWVLDGLPIGKPGEEGVKSCLILCSFKRGNLKLQQLANMLTEHGFALYVHGSDPSSIKATAQITVSSFHASKGEEADVVVVLDVNDRSAVNPLHVAVTRTRERLLVVSSKDDMYEPLAEFVKCDQAKQEESEQILRVREQDLVLVEAYLAIVDNAAEMLEHKKKKVEADDEAAQADEAGEAAQAAETCEATPRPRLLPEVRSVEPVVRREAIGVLYPSKETVKDLTSFAPLGRETRLAGSVQELYRSTEYAPSAIVDSTAIVAVGREANVGDIYLCAAKMRCEFEVTRRVRCIDVMQNPLKKRKLDESIGARIVNGTREFDLLPSFALKLLKTFTAAKLSRMSSTDWVTLGVLAERWHAYHNATHLLLPVDDWVDEDAFLSVFATIRRNIPSRGLIAFDRFAVLKRRPKLTYKARFFAETEHDITQVVLEDDISYDTLCRLAIPAALAKKKALKILNAKSGEMRFYEFPSGSEAFLEKMLL